MSVAVIQGVAILIQCASAFFAIRLVRITERYTAWLLITVSIMLIVARRTISYGRLITGDLSQPPDASVMTESILLLVISIAQAAGILLIGPLFRSIKNAEEELRETNIKIERQVVERTRELAERHRELQETHAKLQETESLRDSLTHMIVHDLRIPLTSIYGFLEALGTFEGDRLSDEGREYLRTASSSTRTLTDMVASLLDVSKMESGRMELNATEWDPALAIEKVLRELEPVRGGRTVTFSPPKEPLTVFADADLMRRVFQNLIGNAFKFTSDGAHIEVGLEGQNGAMRAFVRDDGPGIPLEAQDRIFEKFGQVDAKARQQRHSTGLGLTFCKLAVEAHGGRIWVDSVVGEGSTFWFEIPLRPAAPALDGSGNQGTPSGATPMPP